MSRFRFHMISNAHLDPVWLWNRRDGLNEGLATCQTVLKLMENFPKLTFSRGEAVIYDHIEKSNPQIFSQIRERIKEGRWEVAGGTWLQNDNNLTPTNIIAKNFELGLEYFEKHLGVRPVTAWYADSFGHSAGIPDLLSDYGYMNFVSTRPSAATFKMPKSLFWWQGVNRGKILVYRPNSIDHVYLIERHQMKERLDAALKVAEADGFFNAGVLWGLGDHGGGPTRRHLEDLALWQKEHPEIDVIFSSFEIYLKEVRKELENSQEKLPVYSGELNFCLRGCYGSAAAFKREFRRADASLRRSEKTVKQIAKSYPEVDADFKPLWKILAFNSFHDIIPGSSIKSAYTEQFMQLHHAVDTASDFEFSALNRMAFEKKSPLTKPQPEGDKPKLTPFLLYNSLSHKYTGLVEIETVMDWRPIGAYKDRPAELPTEIRDANGIPVPHQLIPTEHNAWQKVPWSKRALIPVEIPPESWIYLEFGYIEGARNPQIKNPVNTGKNFMRNDKIKIYFKKNAIHIEAAEKPLFGEKGLRFITVKDDWSSWGGMAEEENSIDLSVIMEEWKISKSLCVASGPLRAVWLMEIKGKRSRLILKIILDNHSNFVDFEGTLFWDEIGRRLKLYFETPANECLYEVPGGTVKRMPNGEVPGLRYVSLGDWGLISDLFHSYSQKADCFTATVCRSARYAETTKINQSEWWKPVADQGEINFKFRITGETDKLEEQTEAFENSPAFIRTIPE